MQSLAALENTVFVKTVFLAALVSCSQMLRPHHDCSTNAGMEFVNSDGRDFMVSDGRALDDLVWTVVSVLASGLASRVDSQRLRRLRLMKTSRLLRFLRLLGRELLVIGPYGPKPLRQADLEDLWMPPYLSRH